ncbi:hypothetical protein POM88_010677 [Heracleum sosnowskyi]|uniref:Uncharacterized protein n=1 Tax=Heracleum sosnowskyi TaxID=360622 RepID=A0AAD8N0I9_9APIA|nr:hypothetical protein POM88_010677 [Heracleum sosnowskyi]
MTSTVDTHLHTTSDFTGSLISISVNIAAGLQTVEKLKFTSASLVCSFRSSIFVVQLGVCLLYICGTTLSCTSCLYIPNLPFREAYKFRMCTSCTSIFALLFQICDHNPAELPLSTDQILVETKTPEWGRKREQKGIAVKEKKQDVPTETSKAHVDYDDDQLLQEEEDEHPIFTYNNTPHFPTNSTTSWLPTFKIELGEARYISHCLDIYKYKVDEVRGEDVLYVSRYTSSLNDFWKTKTYGDGTAQHGDIECVANLTRELCKGIVKAFGKVMNSCGKNQPM